MSILIKPIRKIVTILLFSIFLFGYHTCDHFEPGYGNTNTFQQVCFKQGEYTQGMNKVCQYSCTGSGHAITIGAAQLCPLTVRR